MATIFDTIFNWVPYLRRPDQTLGEAQCDSSGSLKVAITATVTTTTIWVDPASGVPLTYRHQLASIPRRLHQLLVENTGSNDGWVMIFDRTTAPTTGAEPVFSFPMPSKQGVSFTLPRARAFSSGIYWGVSSTAGTYTEDATALYRVSAEVE